MADKPDRNTDAPAAYATPQRGSQPGTQSENRAGPNPRSLHETGPHAPYDPNDREGVAAEKHHSDRADLSADVPSHASSATIKIVDLSKFPPRLPKV